MIDGEAPVFLNPLLPTPGAKVFDDEAEITVDSCDPSAVTVQLLPAGTSAGQKHLESPTTQDTTEQPKKVYIQVEFIKLGVIDTVKETFTADVVVQARWREPKLDGIEKIGQQNPAAIGWDQYWNPRICIDNTVGKPTETVKRTVDNDTREAYIVERRRVQGQFFENLELFHFPFDTQDITITVSSERSVDELVLEGDPKQLSKINSKSFEKKQEWHLYNVVTTFSDTIPDRPSISCLKDSERGDTAEISDNPWISCRTYASRRSGFYITNILVAMGLVCSMVFATFSVHHDKRENRIQLALILLLTAVTFKFAVNSSLPRISYLTTLDIYIMTSMTILIMVCVWHAIIHIIDEAWGEDVAKTCDTVAVIVLGSLYFIFHVIFALVVGIRATYVKNFYKEKEREHKKMQEKLQAAPGLQDIRTAASTAPR